MLYLITHLKAPWPVGAKVGDVIDLPSVPVWAVGKCAPAAEDAEATVFVGDASAGGAVITGDGSGQALPPVGDSDDAKASASLAEAEQQAAQERVKAAKKHAKA